MWVPYIKEVRGSCECVSWRRFHNLWMKSLIGIEFKIPWLLSLVLLWLSQNNIWWFCSYHTWYQHLMAPIYSETLCVGGFHLRKAVSHGYLIYYPYSRVGVRMMSTSNKLVHIAFWMCSLLLDCPERMRWLCPLFGVCETITPHKEKQ